jgi:hypothetical protein
MYVILALSLQSAISNLQSHQGAVMRLYMLYAIALASLIIAAASALPGLSDRMRRFITAAVALLVILPSVVFLIFN